MITTIELTEQLATDIDFVSVKELTDAENLARARVFYFRSIGWYQFSTEELLSTAMAAVSEAICRFNPQLGTVKDTKFTSYAYFWIDKYLKEYITRNKTMLSGSLNEHWNNEIPYTQSYDAMQSDSDSPGIDHIQGIRDNEETAEEKMISDDNKLRIHELVQTMLSTLDPVKSTCYKLSFGIGTISGEPMQPREIAKSLCMPIDEVLNVLDEITISLKQKAHEPQYMKMYNSTL